MPIVLFKPKPVEGKMKKLGKAVMKGAVSGSVKKAIKRLPKRGKLRKMKPKVKAIKKASSPGTLYNAQRAKYEKAMNSAMKKGGSTGIGVGP